MLGFCAISAGAISSTPTTRTRIVCTSEVVAQPNTAVIELLRGNTGVLYTVELFPVSAPDRNWAAALAAGDGSAAAAAGAAAYWPR